MPTCADRHASKCNSISTEFAFRFNRRRARPAHVESNDTRRRADQGRAPRERRRASLPLGDVTDERWLMGTHAGAVSDKHLQAYLDDFVFRHNRRKTDGVCRIAERVIESLVTKPAVTMRQLVDGTRRCRSFGPTQTVPV